MSTVLHLIDTTGPGGAETVFVELADRLRDHGHTSIPVIHGPGWVNDELRRSGLQPVILPAGGSFNWGLLLGLRRLVRRHKVDIIQSHLLGSNVYAALTGFLTGVPVVASFHGMVDVDGRDRLKRLRRFIMRLGVRRFVCVSMALREALVAQGFVGSDRSGVIYNGIDVARYDRPRSDVLRHSLGLPPETPLAGCLGNLRPAKGYDVLIRGTAQLKQRGVACHFAIAGQGKGRLANELMALRKELDVEDRVHFLGFQADSAEFLAGLDLFVLPSTSEGFSISTIEAMAAGLPIVATRCGGPEEIISHGQTGLMVQPGDPFALAGAIERLLSDRERARQMAEDARQMARERFDIGQMVKAYLSIYAAVGTQR
jgi:glycosyltransferase involved in cell wall biosynthesis